MNIIKPNEQRGKLAASMIWLVLVMQSLVILFYILQIYLVSVIDNGGNISQTIAYISYYGTYLSNWGYTIAFIISAITFILWFRRAYYNLNVITHNTQYSDGWAAGSWFIPFMNLYVPHSIMKELYTNTNQHLLIEGNPDYEEKLNMMNVNWWWALWIISGIIGNIMLRTESFTEDPNTAIYLALVNGMLTIISAILTIIVIEDYRKAEKLLYDMEVGKTIEVDDL